MYIDLHVVMLKKYVRRLTFKSVGMSIYNL